jgi:hypothetical protein
LTTDDLRRSARRRRKQAFRPGTRANQRCQIASYLKFCLERDLNFLNPSTDTLCLYAEFLALRFTSAKSVKNYLSAINLFHKLKDISAPSLDSFQYQLMLRAIPLTMRAMPMQRSPITPTMLRDICEICHHMSHLGLILKCAFVFGFFGFLRASNLAPASVNSFDASRHTTRSDICIQPPGLVIRLKWSKTHQAPGSPALIPVPAIPGHPLDPVATYTRMITASPTRPPLLTMPDGRPVTVKQLRRALRVILTALGYPAASYSLHSLRRGGATASVRAGADFIHVKRHGTWRSDSFWHYITSHITENSPVAAALSNAVSAL